MTTDVLFQLTTTNALLALHVNATARAAATTTATGRTQSSGSALAWTDRTTPKDSSECEKR